MLMSTLLSQGIVNPLPYVASLQSVCIDRNTRIRDQAFTALVRVAEKNPPLLVSRFVDAVVRAHRFSCTVRHMCNGGGKNPGVNVDPVVFVAYNDTMNKADNDRLVEGDGFTTTTFCKGAGSSGKVHNGDGVKNRRVKLSSKHHFHNDDAKKKAQPTWQ